MAETPDLKYLPINWEDGMLLNKQHLSHQDNYNTERFFDIASLGLTPFNYGVLTRIQTAENCIVQANLDGGSVLKINLEKCIAITPGGFRISYSGLDWKLHEKSIELKDIPEISDKTNEASFYVLLSVNPEKTIPCGIPNAEEDPPRYPYTRFDYNLSIISAEVLDANEPGPYSLPIAMLHYSNKTFIQSDKYIPPCTRINSSKKLQDFLKILQNNLRSLENNSITIIQKVKSKHQENALALGINSIAEQLLISSNILLPFINLQAQHSSVIEILTKISGLARSLKSVLNTWQGIGKEEILSYLAEWCNMNQGAFEKSIDELYNLEYKHHNIQKALAVSNNFFNILTPVFTILADLDYIGKKIDTELFVKEEMFETTEETISKGKKRSLFRK